MFDWVETKGSIDDLVNLYAVIVTISLTLTDGRDHGGGRQEVDHEREWRHLA